MPKKIAGAIRSALIGGWRVRLTHSNRLKARHECQPAGGETMDESLTVLLDFQWPRAPLRCPRCGNRGRGVGQFWVRAWIELDPDTATPRYLHAPVAADGCPAECGRCETERPLSELMPLWPNLVALGDRPPSPLNATDRALEVGWIVFEAAARPRVEWSADARREPGGA